MHKISKISRDLVFGVLAIGAIGLVAFTGAKPNVIYGEDNRADVYEVSNPALKEAAGSTIAMIHKSLITGTDAVNMYISGKTLAEDFNVCSDEPYANQPDAANCSGFLVGEDLIATAGHCAPSLEQCKTYSIVFNYSMKNQTIIPLSVPIDEVYKCKEIVAQEQLDTGRDYALVRLDRPVRGHKILKLSSTAVQVKDPLIMVGNPVGLPTKISGGAWVRKTTDQFFVANLDSYVGNSGSAVLNANTLEVVGILVRGAQDFVTDSARNCLVSNVCTDEGCRGEDVTNISYIAKALGQ